jgi:hypothetical protein
MTGWSAKDEWGFVFRGDYNHPFIKACQGQLPSPRRNLVWGNDVIRCKQLLECGRWHFNPSAVTFNAFDGVEAQVTQLVYCYFVCI